MLFPFGRFLWEIEPSPPILVGDTLEYEVEGILRHQDKGTRHWYLVLWKGYPLTEATYDVWSRWIGWYVGLGPYHVNL